MSTNVRVPCIIPEFERFVIFPKSLCISTTGYIYIGGYEIVSLHPLVSELGSRKLFSPEPVHQPEISGLKFTPLTLAFAPDSNLLTLYLHLVLCEGLR